VGDGRTLNTVVVQETIDRVAKGGGGVVVVPPGRFLTGALFLKPGVHLHLEKGGVLLGSPDIAHYPARPTRIEGHTEEWTPALLNADGCDGLRITGEGTIQGGGKVFWNTFWERRKADKTTKNLDVNRPRNIFIRDSKDVLLRGIYLRESGFWNLHLYRCQNVTIEKMNIQTPSPGIAPSTDGIDLDSCQDVTIRECYIAVDDDCIAMKGSKGPLADQDKESPAVERIRISECTFGPGHAVLTLGSEATHVRDVILENCKIEGSDKNCLLRLKLRPDTPQHYEEIHVRNITVGYVGKLISIEPWTQYFDLKGQEAPTQIVENISLSNVNGSAREFGRISGPEKSVLRKIILENVDLTMKNPEVTVDLDGKSAPAKGSEIRKVEELTLNNVRINGIPLTSKGIGPAAVSGLPSPKEILNSMALANGYFMKKWPDPGKEMVGIKVWPSNIWTRGVYFEGLMALYKINRDERCLKYALDWAEFHKWGLPRGPTTRNADNQCCGQTYLELYELDKKPERIAEIKASIDGLLAGEKVDDWSWIDAIQMAMPIMAKFGVMTGDPRYFERMHAMFAFTRDQHGGNGLWNPEEHLWWRDKDFVPPYKEPNGRNCYWSRGNGWVVAALVRVLDILPPDAPHRQEYVTMLKEMCEALVPLQRPDGFWNVSLLDPGNFGGKETTGTALFTYGMAWGINHGILDTERFAPVVAKAWNAMTSEALHPNGKLGYVQGTGKEPKDGQPVTFDSEPDFDDYGLGCFLLAGSEVYRMSGNK